MSETDLIAPVEYYNQLKGKNIRSIIIYFLGQLFGIKEDILDEISNIGNIIHNASLVIDDIQDNSLVRRNSECAHIKYGMPLSLNAGYLVIFKELANTSFQLKPLIDKLYLAHIGQGMDIYYTTHKIIPTETDYLLMIEYKTGIMFKTIIDLLLEKTNNVVLKKKYTELQLFCVMFSYFFQIRDDYINLTSPAYWKEKGFCQDFDEEKISYIVMSYVNQKMPNWENILLLLHESKNNNEVKIQLLTLFHDNRIFEQVYDKLIQLRMEILKILNIGFIFDQLPVEPFVLNDVSSFLSK